MLVILCLKIEDYLLKLIGKHHVIDNSLTNEQPVSLPVCDIMVTSSVFYTVCGGIRKMLIIVGYITLCRPPECFGFGGFLL